jgi:hypothetical protein
MDPDIEATKQILDAVVGIVMSIDLVVCRSDALGPCNVYLLLALSIAQEAFTSPGSAHEASTRLWLEDFISFIARWALLWMLNDRIFGPA